MTRKQLGFDSLPSIAVAEGATTPNPGQTGVWAWSSTLSKPVHWNGSKWTAGTEPYVVTGFYPGAPAASATLIYIPFTLDVSFLSNFSGSGGKAKTAATAQTDFDVKKNGTSVGTMRFAASATSATFIAASAVDFVSGDTFELVAPATPDATLANIGWAFKGTRT